MDLGKVKRIIIRYIQGQSPKDESQLVDTWLDKLEKKSKLNIDNDDYQKGIIRNRIFSGIEEDIREYDSARILHNWMKVAAIFILIVLCSIYFINPLDYKNTMTYITTVGEQKEIVLPDNSYVLLKANSSLKCPEKFDHTREVELVGEAFFEVKKDPERKFIVHSNQLSVEVKGTSFNVKAYNKLSVISVLVSTGKVSVRHANQTLGLLLPNDKLVFNKYTKQSSITKSELMPDVKDSNTLSFEKASLNEILVTLENYYDVEFDIKVTKEVELSGSFNSTMPINNIVEALNSIAERHNIKIIKQGDNKYRVE